MSRAESGGRVAEHTTGEPEPPRDTARIARDIGVAALELAGRAHAAGLPTLGFLLENAALEAGSEAATRQWPADAAQR